jgi:hypothetical protein
MKLDEALLCIECETLYSSASACPRCGSRVSYPLSRALNRSCATIDRLAQSRAHEECELERPAASVAARALRLVRSA